MAAGDSAVSICDIGLVMGLGEDPIASLSDARKAAILCNLRYDQMRRVVLRLHSWSFAKKQGQLAASATAPLFGYSNAFTLPADYIRVADIPGDGSNQEKWKVYGRSVFSDDAGALNFPYIYDCQDTTMFDPLFVDALGYAIAFDLAIPLLQDKGMRDRMKQEFADRVALAKSVDGQDNGSDQFDIDILLQARN
jgi:hypothetical protein